MPISRGGIFLEGRISEAERWWWEGEFEMESTELLDVRMGAVEGGVRKEFGAASGGATMARPERFVCKPRRSRNVLEGSCEL